MDPILGALFIAGVIWAGRKAAGQVRADFRKSRAGSGKRPWQHAAAWWGREVSRGFPVHRAGFGRGWLAHQTALDQRRAQREEARTSHLEARASIASEWAAHRRRQAEAQARIDQAREPQPAEQPEDELARKRAKGVPPLPADNLAGHLKAPMRDPRLNDRQRERDQNGQRNVCAACGHPGTATDELIIDDDGYRIHRSHIASPAKEGTEHMATATDTNYTESLRMAREVEAEADAAISDIRWQKMSNLVDEIGALMRGDTATLSDAADVADALKAQQKAMEETRDSAAAFASGLQRRHGGIKEAHDDAPVQAAESEFYED